MQLPVTALHKQQQQQRRSTLDSIVPSFSPPFGCEHLIAFKAGSAFKIDTVDERTLEEEQGYLLSLASLLHVSWALNDVCYM
jgi:hypothetical protein